MKHIGYGTLVYDPPRGVMNARADAAIALYNCSVAELESNREKDNRLAFTPEGKLTLRSNVAVLERPKPVSVEAAIRNKTFYPSDRLIQDVAAQHGITATQLRNAFDKAMTDPQFRRKADRAAWWCVVNVHPEITRYYRWWVKKERWIELNAPAWDAHITVIRGERPPADKMDLWKKYHGEKIQFSYYHNVRQSGDTTGGDRPDNYWFVDVESERLSEIRQEFGFSTKWKYHLTIGRTYD